ncbi:MAG TPA: hypothetical protein VF681_04175 [Abditibacteriaceae bacterium]|jgi:hypothetical protein
MNKWFLGVVLGGAGIATIALPAQAQNVVEGAAPVARTIYMYNAGPGLGGNKLGAWGNGEAGNSRQWTYNGEGVLRIRSRNLYEGARFDLATPLDIAPYKRDGFFRLRLRFKLDPRAVVNEVEGVPGEGNPEGGAGGGRGGQGGQGGGRGGQGAGPRANAIPETRVSTVRHAQFGPLPTPNAPRRGQPGAGMPPLGGMPGEAPGMVGEGGGMEPIGPPAQLTPVTLLRVSLMHDKGATFGNVKIDLDDSEPDDEGWRTFFFPVRDMRSTPDVEGLVRRVVLTSDVDESFWLAQMALVTETGKMTASIRRPTDPTGAQIADITVKPGPFTLVADVESGIADPIIEWNFDADNVGNLPPAALSLPPEGTPGAMEGMEGETPIIAEVPVGPDGLPLPALGPRIDARGMQARFEYPNEEQNYRVEVTVRDRSGQKTPVKASILVRVRG